MLATALTAAVVGVEAHLVRVEVDASPGFPKFTMVGLPDSSVRESEGRIRAALRNCGYGFKWDRRITVNLAPAGLRKVGAGYDLATAVGLLAADGALPLAGLSSALLVGELALDGSLRAVAGVLPVVLMARELGMQAVIVPEANLGEAAVVPGVCVYPAGSLAEAAQIAAAAERPTPARRLPPPPPTLPPPDLADVRGQALARRAIEIAAGGGHNLLLVGPPGAGKTMLARRLLGVLPPLTEEEAVETSAIHSAWGARLTRLLQERPFRSPHHTASDAALVGGGSLPRPGEVTLAHNGVLFLDELPEFRRRSLEALREPLEERAITVCRARATLRLPARFQLVAAMNPCPCGALGSRNDACGCTPREVRAYRGRISGPLLDRIDLHAEVVPLSYAEMSAAAAESSASVGARVRAARERQAARARQAGARCNADLSPEALRGLAVPDADGRRLLGVALDRLGLSGRAHDRVLRVARTLADLEGCGSLAGRHVAEALQFRCRGLEAQGRVPIQSLGENR
jgi:magnesium chelatase family protein